jgi:hypothetical protein
MLFSFQGSPILKEKKVAFYFFQLAISPGGRVAVGHTANHG